MKVSELIKNLQELPQNDHVVVQGYEDGFDDVSMIMPVSIKLGAEKKWYNGRYDGVDEGEKAVLIFGISRMEHE